MNFFDMKHLLIFITAAVISLNSCNSTKTENKEETDVETTANEATAMLDPKAVIADSETFDGAEVVLKGTVVHVCKHSGKRLHLMGADEKTKIRVEAGEIGKFERELEGSEILVKGVFKREIIDEEYLSKWESELKKEGGEHHGSEGEHNESEGEHEEKEGKIKRYREMMKETAKGRIENYWIEGVSFEVSDDTSI